jgi:acetyltransferase
METLIDYGRKELITQIEGEVLVENATMLKMCREFGFHVEASSNDAHVRAVKLDLDRVAPALGL